MPLESALKAVDYLAAHSACRAEVLIAFYGGEPLLNLPLIRRTTDHARQAIQGERLILSLTTNGTLLDGEAMDFLVANDFSTFVSLDGPREANDRNRVFAGSGKGTYDAAAGKLREFQQRHPDYCRRAVRLSMVAAPGADFARMARWLRTWDLASASVTHVADHTGEFEREYQQHPVTGADRLRAELIEAGRRDRLGELRGRLHFAIHTSLFAQGLSALRKRTLPASPRDRTISRGICIPGKQKLFVDCGGDLFPCEKTDGSRHLHLGHIDTGVDAQKARDILQALHDFLAADCASCWLWRLCPVCFMGPTAGHGYDRGKARRVCDAHRREMAAMLATYCAILERNPHGLDCFLDDGPAAN